MSDQAVNTNEGSVERFSEFAPLRPQQPDGLATPGDNPNVKVEFEQQDVSIGKGRYRGRIPISNNLALEPRKKGTPRIIPHANVKVTLVSQNGRPAKMTERYVRNWTISPLQADAAVDNLSQWRIQGLHHTEFIPFSPMPLSNKEQLPASFWEHPSAEDAPGLDAPMGDVFGILQEFVIGNPEAGGAYYQVYTLSDQTRTRVFSTNAVTFGTEEYLKLVRRLNSPAYKKEYLHKLYFMPTVLNDEITTNPRKLPVISK